MRIFCNLLCFCIHSYIVWNCERNASRAYIIDVPRLAAACVLLTSRRYQWWMNFINIQQSDMPIYGALSHCLNIYMTSLCTELIYRPWNTRHNYGCRRSWRRSPRCHQSVPHKHELVYTKCTQFGPSVVYRKETLSLHTDARQYSLQTIWQNQALGINGLHLKCIKAVFISVHGLWVGIM